MATAPAHRLNASTWAYQLQDVNMKALIDHEADVVVIDAFDGNGQRWEKEEIAALQMSGKIVLCYFSIGEAEDYRPYWNPRWTGLMSRFTKPAWLGPENPEWEGNYKVKYWFPEWQRIMKDELSKIIGQGFDGIYLDIIDAYQYWANDVHDSDRKMVKFVQDLAQYARARSGASFHVVPQNGEGLLIWGDYRDVISAVGKEDVFYEPDDDGVARHDKEVNLQLAFLEENATANHIQVLFVEYGDEEFIDEEVDAQIDYIRSKLPRSMRNAPVYAATRPLDRLIDQ